MSRMLKEWRLKLAVALSPEGSANGLSQFREHQAASGLGPEARKRVNAIGPASLKLGERGKMQLTGLERYGPAAFGGKQNDAAGVVSAGSSTFPPFLAVT